MHMETSADARRSARHTVSGGHDGPAAGGRGYLATAASRFSSWWSGERRPQGLTADTESGAGLQARNEGKDHPPNGDAASAPPADGYTASDPDRRAPKIQDLTKVPGRLARDAIHIAMP